MIATVCDDLAPISKQVGVLCAKQAGSAADVCLFLDALHAAHTCQHMLFKIFLDIALSHAVTTLGPQYFIVSEVSCGGVVVGMTTR